MFRSAGYCSGPGTSIELLKISWLIDCYRIYRGLYYLVYWGLLGIMITHSRETYQPTSIMRWGAFLMAQFPQQMSHEVSIVSIQIPIIPPFF